MAAPTWHTTFSLLLLSRRTKSHPTHWQVIIISSHLTCETCIPETINMQSTASVRWCPISHPALQLRWKRLPSPLSSWINVYTCSSTVLYLYFPSCIGQLLSIGTIPIPCCSMRLPSGHFILDLVNQLRRARSFGAWRIRLPQRLGRASLRIEVRTTLVPACSLFLLRC